MAGLLTAERVDELRTMPGTGRNDSLSIRARAELPFYAHAARHTPHIYNAARHTPARSIFPAEKLSQNVS